MKLKTFPEIKLTTGWTSYAFALDFATKGFTVEA